MNQRTNAFSITKVVFKIQYSIFNDILDVGPSNTILLFSSSNYKLCKLIRLSQLLFWKASQMVFKLAEHSPVEFNYLDKSLHNL